MMNNKRIHTRILAELAELRASLASGGGGEKTRRAIKIRKPDGSVFILRCDNTEAAILSLADKYSRNYARKKYARSFRVARREPIEKLIERYANDEDELFDGFYSLASFDE